MENYIFIKFNKDAIQSKTDESLTLKTFVTQDNFLNQFTYHSIITDEILLLGQKKTNTINYESLVGICYVQGLDNMSLKEKENLAKKMEMYDFVEYAYVPKPLKYPPLPMEPENKEKFIHTQNYDIPDFTHLQSYKDGIEKNHIGIDMEYAWSIGVTGQGIRCAVFEYGYDYNHINLKRDSFIEFFDNIKSTKPPYPHGTATSGILYANDIGTGIKGLVYGADTFYFVDSENNPNPDFPIDDDNTYAWLRLADSLLKLYPYLETGDVISFSIGYDYWCLDVGRVMWDILKVGTEAGIIMCCGAGNFARDLDNDNDPELKSWRNRPDIGIIHVGAGDEHGEPAYFSNYGKMVHVQAWGNRNIVTTGYGDLYTDGINNYTKSFGGTSSATPMVASAAIAVQSWYKQQTWNVLTPFEMRELLIKTGTPQSGYKHIGPIPNVRNAINELQRRLQ